MQAPEDFTLVLSSTKDKIENTPYQLSSFSTNLGSTIKLVGHYKCALTYLHYPKTYYNVEKCQLKLIAFYKLDNAVKNMSSAQWRNFEADHRRKVMTEVQMKYHVIGSEISDEYRKEEAIAIYRFPGKTVIGNRAYDIWISDALYRDETELVTEINNQMDKLVYTDHNNVKYTNHIPHAYLVRTKGTIGLRAGLIADSGLVFPELSTEIQNYLGFRKYFQFLDSPNESVPEDIVDKTLCCNRV